MWSRFWPSPRNDFYVAFLKVFNHKLLIEAKFRAKTSRVFLTRCFAPPFWLERTPSRLGKKFKLPAKVWTPSPAEISALPILKMLEMAAKLYENSLFAFRSLLFEVKFIKQTLPTDNVTHTRFILFRHFVVLFRPNVKRLLKYINLLNKTQCQKQ